ncbi:MAG: alpha/beta fold hydrolase [Marinagarivorans sp.]|nr:alpha/beta fold hydrolase [Marinagarivorans sp.]
MLANALSENYAVYSLDLPNHGRSPHSDSMTLGGMAADVERWMDEQSIQRAHFIGHSLGGKVTMELALKSAHRLEKLAVIDIAPVCYEPHHSDIFAGLQALDIANLSSRSVADAFLHPYVPELAIRSFLLKNLVKADSGFEWRMNLSAITKNYPSLIAANQLGDTFKGDVLFFKGRRFRLYSK